jgi:hypothetical protein
MAAGTVLQHQLCFHRLTCIPVSDVQAARYPNVASIVMHHALLKALGKHNLAMDKHQQQLLAAGELQQQELLPELSYEELTVSMSHELAIV